MTHALVIVWHCLSLRTLQFYTVSDVLVVLISDIGLSNLLVETTCFCLGSNLIIVEYRNVEIDRSVAVSNRLRLCAKWK